MDPIHIVGGGTKNQLLSQFAANAMGRQVITGPIEATALGNVIVQAIAMGHLGSLAEGRDLVRRSIIESAVKDENSDVIGTLTIVYDHDAPGVTDRLLELQHHHHDEIMTTTHIHLDEDKCLEVLIVRGRSRAVRTLADNIKALKGVKHGELVVTANNR